MPGSMFDSYTIFFIQVKSVTIGILGKASKGRRVICTCKDAIFKNQCLIDYVQVGYKHCISWQGLYKYKKMPLTNSTPSSWRHLLWHYQTSKNPFIAYTDASFVGLRAALHRKQVINGREVELLFCFISRASQNSEL